MNDFTHRWQKLLNESRRKQATKATKQRHGESVEQRKETRTEIERDYDRILFATPVRRLADKTQVFPLDANDSVRTRLTHSHEVSNLGRSIGTALAFEFEVGARVPNFCRNLPSLLAAAGLVHDLGNPPFGHQGEVAIQSWFKEHRAEVLETLAEPQHQLDFINFEGNAQGFRLVTRLQLLNDDFGLDLTYASLAAMMKYPTKSNEVSKDEEAPVAAHKHGFFATEQHIAEQVLSSLGLSLGKRHPVAYIMEACDDIAYVVLDAEDAVKKGLASFSDVLAFLGPYRSKDKVVATVLKKSKKKHDEYRSSKFQLSPAELNDISMQMFRVYAISELVSAATKTFVDHQAEYVNGTARDGLLKRSEGETLRKELKSFSYKHAYSHRSVLKIELQGYNVIRRLMDIFWAAIVDREEDGNPSSKRVHPFSRFVYGRISENYRRVFEQPTEEVARFPLRYRECQLLTDMVSGMTDSYAIDLCNELTAMQGCYDPDRIRNEHSSST